VTFHSDAIRKQFRIRISERASQFRTLLYLPRTPLLQFFAEASPAPPINRENAIDLLLASRGGRGIAGIRPGLRQAMAPPQLREEKSSNAIQIRYIRTVNIQAQKRDAKSQDRAFRIIRNYLFKIFDKLGVSTRVELVLYCLQERQRSNPDSDA